MTRLAWPCSHLTFRSCLELGTHIRPRTTAREQAQGERREEELLVLGIDTGHWAMKEAHSGKERHEKKSRAMLNRMGHALGRA